MFQILTLGYIFDDMEYAKFTADQSPILRLFGQFFSSNDVIILGSEFQETDLSIINEIYQATGNDLSHKYFFVGPKISDLLLRTKNRKYGELLLYTMENKRIYQ